MCKALLRVACFELRVETWATEPVVRILSYRRLAINPTDNLPQSDSSTIQPKAISKIQITFKYKARTDEKAEHTQ